MFWRMDRPHCLSAFISPSLVSFFSPLPLLCFCSLFSSSFSSPLFSLCSPIFSCLNAFISPSLASFFPFSNCVSLEVLIRCSRPFHFRQLSSRKRMSLSPPTRAASFSPLTVSSGKRISSWHWRCGCFLTPFFAHCWHSFFICSLYGLCGFYRLLHVYDSLIPPSRLHLDLSFSVSLCTSICLSLSLPVCPSRSYSVSLCLHLFLSLPVSRSAWPRTFLMLVGGLLHQITGAELAQGQAERASKGRRVGRRPSRHGWRVSVAARQQGDGGRG